MIVSSASLLERMIVACSRWSSSQVAAQEQAAHADDRVHRGADLVAHGRQEDALRRVGRVGDLACVLRVGEEPCVVECDRCELGEALQQIDVGLRERAAVRRCSRAMPSAPTTSVPERSGTATSAATDPRRMSGRALPRRRSRRRRAACRSPRRGRRRRHRGPCGARCPARTARSRHGSSIYVLARAREVDVAVGSVEQCSRRARSAHAAARRGRGAA